MPDFSTIIDLVNKGGTITLLLIIIATGVKGLWVFGWQYRQAISERDEWKNLALSGTDLAEKIAELHKNGKDTNPQK